MTTGVLPRVTDVLAFSLAAYALYWVVGIVDPHVYRISFLLIALVLTFLVPGASESASAGSAGAAGEGERSRPPLRVAFDVALIALTIAALVWPLTDTEAFVHRAATPTITDLVLGCVLILVILEATRRTSGWVLPVTALAFLAYGYYGPLLDRIGLSLIAHRGYSLERLVGTLYMTLEGIFGTAVDVSSSLIILFTIYGAMLQFSGAGKFYLDFSFAALGGKPTGAGRTIVLSSFLLGGPSGSGVATTVTLGTVAYPMLAKAGYEKNAAGGLLAAGGLGAILSPPVLGAAAFLIAEFLKISYLDVIKMATIPTCLYYLSLFLMVEIDARKYDMKLVEVHATQSAWQLTKTQGFHFFSLISIVVFMLVGFSPIGAVFWATAVAVLTSFIHRDCALLDLRLLRDRPKGWVADIVLRSKLVKALETGSTGMINVGATCAAAGIIVGIVTLTGLGLRFSEIVISYAGGSLVLTAIFTALIVWVIGLAVPVTASYIICAVIAAPALIKLGVPDYAAHMFIFYYAVLSEVSPPTALSPFAAAAITGGDPYKTTLQSWKYTLPAFVVPFMFVLDPIGTGLLLTIPKGGTWVDVVTITVLATIALVALAGAAEGWLLRKTSMLERLALLAAGILVLTPAALNDAIGIGLLAAVIVIQFLKLRARAVG